MSVTANTTPVSFTLNGNEVTAQPGESIWQVADRLGTEIPHLCYQPEPGYNADGNCRTCMVEIEGERTLAASCIREPSEGMVVTTNNARAKNARKMVVEAIDALGLLENVEDPQLRESLEKMGRGVFSSGSGEV